MSKRKGRETAFIVHPVLPADPGEANPIFYTSPEEQLAEAEGLARAIDLDVIGTRIVRLNRPHPGALLGEGVREEINAFCREHTPAVVIVNGRVSPVQQKNLEKEWECKVIDRTGLILEIFGARAQTREGKIQVELAALEYQKSRLVRSWTHLERQRGGAGFMGGPGETQLELDRRIIDNKIIGLKKDLERVKKTRTLQRKTRERVPYPVIALVGYTNAGKSTLFNAMTGAKVFAKDLLFATLDPTMRRVRLDNKQDVIFSDTVGFIADLPTHLIAAFRATLEQVIEADVILHIQDIAHPAHQAQHDNVVKILRDLGIDYEEDRRIIEVWNKIDSLDPAERARLTAHMDEGRHEAVMLSALTGEGLPLLRARIESHIGQDRLIATYRIPASDGAALAWLQSRGKALETREQDGYIIISVGLEAADIQRAHSRFGLSPAEEPHEARRS